MKCMRQTLLFSIALLTFLRNRFVSNSVKGWPRCSPVFQTFISKVQGTGRASHGVRVQQEPAAPWDCFPGAAKGPTSQYCIRAGTWYPGSALGALVLQHIFSSDMVSFQSFRDGNSYLNKLQQLEGTQEKGLLASHSASNCLEVLRCLCRDRREKLHR